MTGMTRPYLSDFPTFYQGYVKIIESDDILQTLKEQQNKTSSFFENLPEGKANYAYAEDKWTIKEVLGHLIDTERVFVFRALSFARGEEQPLPGFDENTYVPAGRFRDRTLQSLIDEYTTVRQASITFFENLREEDWAKTGIANKGNFTVNSLAYIIAGHNEHHLQVLTEKYV